LEDEFDRIRMLLGHDNRMQGSAPAAYISRAEQYAWSECPEPLKINPEAHR